MIVLPVHTRVICADGVLRDVKDLKIDELIHSGGDERKRDLWVQVTAVRDEIGVIPVMNIGLESLRSVFLSPAQKVKGHFSRPNVATAELTFGYYLKAFVWDFVRVNSIESGGTTKCIALEIDGPSLWLPESDIIVPA